MRYTSLFLNSRFWITSFLFFLTSFIIICNGQTDIGFEHLENGNHEAAKIAFSNDLSNKKRKAVAEYGLSKVYLDTAYAEFNPDTSWRYYLACYETLKTIKSNKKQKYLEKHNIKLTKIKSQIPEAGLQVAKAKNTTEAYENFIKVFKKAPSKYNARAVKSRNRIAFELAKNLNTYAGYQDFIATYQTSLKHRNPSILKQAKLRLFEVYIEKNGWSELETFAKDNPDNPYVLDNATEEFRKIEKSNNLELHRDFLDQHKESILRNFSLNKIADLILENGKTEDHNWFVFSFPDHKSSNALWENYLQLYIKENGESSVIDFATEFPQYPFKEELLRAKNKTIESQLTNVIKNLENSTDVNELLSFLETYPESFYSAEINNRLLPLLKQNPSVNYFERYFALNISLDEMPDLLNHMYQIYAWDLNLEALNTFMQSWGKVLPDTSFVSKDRALAKEKIRLRLKSSWSEKNTTRYDEFIKKAAPNYAAYQALQKMLSPDIQLKNWSFALGKMENYKSYFKEESTAFNQLYDVLKAEEQEVILTNLSSAINTDNNEYAPVISADGKTLYFCAKNRMDNLGREDIFFSQNINGTWTPAKLLDGINTTVHSEAPEAISVDGSMMLIFKGGKLTYSNKTEKGWSSITRFPSIINQEKWQADASISSDGKAILFTSQRANLVGNPNRNNLDIYVALADNDGKWNKVLNLGSTVNTPRIDRSPYLHPDMKTLYFSSIGHGGLGGMDVFKTTRLDDTWTNWSTPINLGREVNTSESDWGYKVSTEGSIAYFNSSTENGDEDIFQIELPEKMRPRQVSTLAGVLLDSNGLPIEADIIIEDLSTGTKVLELKSDPNTGEFFAVLPDQKKYSYYVKKENFFPISNNIDLTTNQNLVINKKIKLYEVTELASKGLSLTLENIFFDTDKYELKPASFQELDRLAALILSNNFKIDVAGHTDDSGKESYNKILSQNRANAVMNYFSQKGIPPAHMTARGFGESRPIVDNSTEEGKAKNRRVEIRFKN